MKLLCEEQIPVMWFVLGADSDSSGVGVSAAVRSVTQLQEHKAPVVLTMYSTSSPPCHPFIQCVCLSAVMFMLMLCVGALCLCFCAFFLKMRAGHACLNRNITNWKCLFFRLHSSNTGKIRGKAS